jgi:hypothetical protein
VSRAGGFGYRPIPPSNWRWWRPWSSRGRSRARASLLADLASHASIRIWSAFDFIPKALAFERADPATIAADGAAMLAAFAAAVAP